MQVTLTIGSLALDSVVALAPMAGVTNIAFRTLCREQELERTGTVSGLYICEMITARALVERNEKTLHMTTFGPQEDIRSLQLYTVDPEYTYKAAKMIAENNMADHIDMNFGCPVPKVTKRGGGSALPYKRRLFGNIVAAAVKGVEGTDIPITVKFRMGIDDDHLTYLDAGRIAAEEGAAAVTLHTLAPQPSVTLATPTGTLSAPSKSTCVTPGFPSSAMATSSNPKTPKPCSTPPAATALSSDAAASAAPGYSQESPQPCAAKNSHQSQHWAKSPALSTATQNSWQNTTAKGKPAAICANTWAGTCAASP